MIDLMTFLTGTPTVAGTAAPVTDAPAEGEDAFATLLDAVVADVAAVMQAVATPQPAPTTPAPTPELPVDLTLLLGDAEQPVPTDDKPAAHPLPEGDVVAMTVARTVLGLPTPAAEPLQSAPIRPDHNVSTAPIAPDAPPARGVGVAVAVGRAGVMPTLPEQAHATLPTPPGIARRFPVAAVPVDTVAGPPASPEPAAAVISEPPAVARAVADVDTDVLAPIASPSAQEAQSTGAAAPLTKPVDAPLTKPVDAPVHEVDGLVAAVDAPVDAPAPVVGESVVSESVGDDAVLERLSAAIPAMPEMSDAAPAAAMAARPVDSPTSTLAPREHEHIHGIARPLRAALHDAPRDRPNTITLTVRLDPPELGAVRLHVVAHGDRVHVTMHAESPEAVLALNDRRQDVVELLRNDGFSLDGFDIDARDGDQRRGDTPEQSRRRTEQFTLEPDYALPQTDDNELRL